MVVVVVVAAVAVSSLREDLGLSLIHISEPT